MASIQNGYSINPDPGPPTIVITIQLREFNWSRSGELKDKLEEDAKEMGQGSDGGRYRISGRRKGELIA